MRLHNKNKIPFKGIKAAKEHYKERREKIKPLIIKLRKEGLSLRKIVNKTRYSRVLITKIVREIEHEQGIL
jgi:hypothetical protein